MDSTFRRVRTRDRREEAMPERLRLAQVHRVESSGPWARYARERYAVGQKRPHACTPVSAYCGAAHGAAHGGELQTRCELDMLRPQFRESVNEAYLWHGTSPESALGISQDGFRLDRAGTGAGSMFGLGLYFAECSSKSDEYAKDDTSGVSKGLFCLLLCRVVLGEMLHMTAGGDATHAMINRAIVSEAYDSVLGDREASVGTYREFVVYEEAAVYPEYLVLYRRDF
mmetsp:Transcript_88179/g.249873  ORF Transcript_88179/g.249873 Transcript_88179/m.249873 type:complete len:227 (+) Transcript_88179:3-683(+)